MSYAVERHGVGTLDGDILGIGSLFQGLASGASAIPGIMSAFGKNKGEKAAAEVHQQEQQRAIQAEIQLAQIQAGTSNRAWDAAKTAAPWVGGALGIGALAWGVSRVLASRRTKVS